MASCQAIVARRIFNFGEIYFRFAYDGVGIFLILLKINATFTGCNPVPEIW